mmetsp:Transcript_9051/g.23324  ORF Transcript_9051/g.23324 Transcript_9051/m.23324 type:complete len:231 (+) Transcript_9051:370-1062(+)
MLTAVTGREGVSATPGYAVGTGLVSSRSSFGSASPAAPDACHPDAAANSPILRRNAATGSLPRKSRLSPVSTTRGAPGLATSSRLCSGCSRWTKWAPKNSASNAPWNFFFPVSVFLMSPVSSRILQRPHFSHAAVSSAASAPRSFACSSLASPSSPDQFCALSIISWFVTPRLASARGASSSSATFATSPVRSSCRKPVTLNCATSTAVWVYCLLVILKNFGSSQMVPKE